MDEKMNYRSDSDDDMGKNVAAAILGANCTTGMAVAAGLTGVGLAVALPVVVVGAVLGVFLKSLCRE